MEKRLRLLKQKRNPGPGTATASRLAAIVECTDDAIISKDLRGTIVTWNKAAERLFGYRAREAIGRQITMLMPPDRIAEERHILHQVRLGRRVDHYETVRVCKDGRRVEVSLSVSPLRDPAGRIVGAIKIARDVTGQKRIEAALRASERRMRAIVETAVDAIVTIDPRGIIQSLNSSTERMFGYGAAELVGRNVSVLMPDPYRADHDGYLRNSWRSGKAPIISLGREVTALRKDGTTFPVNLSISEVRTDDERLFIGMVHDLSARRALERQIVEASADEQRRIGQDLHDGLCQDLVGIAFQADSAARALDGTSPSAAEAVRKVAASCREAAGQARRLAHWLNPVDLEAGGLPAALESLAGKISQSFGVACAFHWDGLAQVADDAAASHLYRIAQEAISNAIKHGRARKVDVRLAAGKGRLVMRIQDDGQGLPAGGRTSASTPPHDGIGLHTMRYRAHLIGGSLDIRSQARHSTSVTCSVPIGSGGTRARSAPRPVASGRDARSRGRLRRSARS